MEEELFDETSDVDTDQETTTSAEDIEKIKAENAKLKSILIRKKEKEQRTLTTQKPKQNSTVDDEVVARLSNLEIIEAKRQFGYQHGLAPDAVDYLFKIKSNPTAEDLNDPFIKGGIEAITRKERLADNTPSSSIASRTIEGKTFDNMTDEEKRANYGKLSSQIVKNRKS